jgi:hypothetical protein
MAITITYDTFKKKTERSLLHTKSSRLRVVLSALKDHEGSRSARTAAALKGAMDEWHRRDENEIEARNVDNIITNLKQQVDAEYDFFKAFLVANKVARYLLNRRGHYIVNDADLSEENRPALKMSFLDQLQMVLKKDASPKDTLAQLNKTSKGHWEHKAREVLNKGTMALRCAECAALVIHVLRHGGFGLPLSVIEQGLAGHFWVVAGTIVNDPPLDREGYGPDTFTIDLWGNKCEDNVKLVTGPPGKRPFPMNNNKVKTLVTWN